MNIEYFSFRRSLTDVKTCAEFQRQQIHSAVLQDHTADSLFPTAVHLDSGNLSADGNPSPHPLGKAVSILW